MVFRSTFANKFWPYFKRNGNFEIICGTYSLKDLFRLYSLFSQYRSCVNRPLSHSRQFESQESKKLCFCPSSLALDERLDGQNLFVSALHDKDLYSSDLILCLVHQNEYMQAWIQFAITLVMNKTKDQISWVSSYDVYWEKKMYKGKRFIQGFLLKDFYCKT